METIVMKAIINNVVIHCILIFFFVFILIHLLFKLGSLFIFQTFYLDDDGIAGATFIGIIMGIVAIYFYVDENDD